MIRRGMTLVEMMVAVTATLILMGAIAQLFSVFGTAVSRSRAALEIDSKMRVAAWRLRSDLDGLTASPLPRLRPDAGQGYLEILEGPNVDSLLYFYPAGSAKTLTPVPSPGPFNTLTATSPGPGTESDDRLIGDYDDVLLFTTRSKGPLFLGSGTGEKTFESPVAEVAWFARATPGTSNPTTFTLYRKQLLVMGHVGVAPFNDNNSAVFTSWSAYYRNWDISARSEGGRLIPNTLADLTKPENRFMHARPTPPSVFPFLFVPHIDTNTSGTLPSNLNGLIFDTDSPRYGEDVVLRNVVAFDVRVFDPAAPVRASGGGTALVPGDPGFNSATSDIASGAYVDLGNQASTSLASATNSLLPASLAPRFATYGTGTGSLVGSANSRRIYDTFSTHYESDGIDQEVTEGLIDEGSNGLDDDSDSQVDEWDEQEGRTPYNYPLRGIEVRIRCYEPSSRQVRQVTVRHTFVPH